MTLSAAEIVAEYLSNRRGARGEFKESDKVIDDATRQIVEQMPDGFRKRDVINCVKIFTRDDEALNDLKPYRRALVAGKTLNIMVDNNELAYDEELKVYNHISF